MNRRAKVLTVSGILLLLIAAILTLAISTNPTSAQNWQNYLTLEYNTDNCLGICEAIFTVKNPSATAIPLLSNDVRIWHVVGKGLGLTKEIEVYREEAVSYQEAVPDYGNCSFVDGNGTTVTYTCQTGTHNETRTRKDFVPFSFEGKTLTPSETWKIKLVGYKKPSLGENNVEWLLDFKGLQPPWAWWLSNYTYYRNNSVNSTTTSSIKNILVPINGSEGFRSSINREHAWCLLDDLPSASTNTTIIFYYNSSTDYRCVNASDNKELPLEVEMGNGTTRGDIKAALRSSNHEIVDHFNGTCYESTGQFTPTCSGITYNDSGVIGKSVILDTTSDKITYGAFAPNGNISIGFWIYLSANPAATRYVISNIGSGGAAIGINASGGMHVDHTDCAGSGQGGSAPINSSIDIPINTWTHIAVVASRQAPFNNITFYQDGLPRGHISGCWEHNTESISVGNVGQTCINCMIDNMELLNVTLSRNEIKARYELLAPKLNWTVLGGEKTQSGDISESTGDSAILSGIALSVINTSNSNYTSQQIYMRTANNTQKLGRFDVVAVSGNQRWAFNYVTSGDPTSSFTYMVNITPTLYVWEAANKTSAQITSEVTAFINSTKQ